MLQSKFDVSILVICFLVLVSGCSTQKVKEAGRDKLNPELALALDASLAESLGQSHGSWVAPRAEKTMKRVVSKLELAMQTVNLKFLKTDKVFIRAGVFRTIFISHGALKAIRFENELAFLLARELSVLQTGNARILLSAENKIPTTVNASDWLENKGVFHLDPQEILRLDRLGTQMTYDAHYDPRGAATLLTRWDKQGAGSFDQAKTFPSFADRLQEVRDEIAKLSPVRNPIITSQDFDDFLSWLGAYEKKGKNNAGRTAVN